MNRLYNNKGYTLLFAALTAALVLGVAVFILSVSRKQYILASTARDSLYSIYAADSGIECVALRNGDWDGSFNPISSTTIESAADSGDTSSVYLNCNGVQFPVWRETDPAHDTVESDDDIRQGYSYIDTGGGTCAEIIITTGHDIRTGEEKKVYDARGYNLCKGTGTDIRPNLDSPRTVERALRLTYMGVW